MAINLTDSQIAELKEIGISGVTQEDVREDILKCLESIDIDRKAMDDDPFDDLYYIVSTLKEEILEKKASEANVESDVEITSEVVEVSKTKKVKEEKKSKKVLSKETPEELAALKEEVAAMPKKEKVLKERKVSAKSKVKPYHGEDPEMLALAKKTLGFLEKSGELNVRYQPSCIPVSLASTDSGRSLFTITKFSTSNGKTTMKVVVNILNLFKNQGNLADMLSENIQEEFRDSVKIGADNTYPLVQVSAEDVEKLLNPDFLKFLIEKLQKFDTKLRSNRKKMEEDVEKE